MALDYDEATAAIRDAEITVYQADRMVGEIARLCVDRLRSGQVGRYTLSKLKRELRDFNMHTGRWKEG